MTPNVRRFVEVVVSSLNIKDPVVEIGSFIVKGHESLANLRNLIPRHEYIGCDIRNGPGVDRIENVEKLTFKNDSVGTILILETLEHVKNPLRAVKEIHRVLKKDGVVIASSLMNFHIHDFPHDYWRFTPKAFEYLFKDFPVKIVGYCGDSANYPTNIFGVGFKSKTDKKHKILLKSLNEKKRFISGRKPIRHRFKSLLDYLKLGILEIDHKYVSEYFLADNK